MILLEESVDRLSKIFLLCLEIAFDRKIKINFINKIIRKPIRKEQ